MSSTFLTGCFGFQFSKLARTRESSSKTLIYWLKLYLLIGISAIAAWCAGSLWSVVNRHPALQAWPYDVRGNIRTAFWWNFVSATVICVWTIVSLALVFSTSRHSNRWLHVWGTVDLALACFACYAINQQSPHVPYTFEKCRRTKVESWQAIDGYPSIFQKIASMPGESTSAGQICKRFAGLWVTSVTYVFFQCLVAYIGIFSHSDPYSILNPHRPPYILLKLLCLPILAYFGYVLPFIRFSKSHLQKFIAHLHVSQDVEPMELVSYIPPKHPFSNPKSKLIDLFLMEHVLLNIVKNLHHDELVSLSSTCRSVREAIFPRHDLTMRIPKLLQTCCSAPTRNACFTCNKIICAACSWPSLAGPQPNFHHTTSCTPYCRTCYYANYSHHTSRYRRPCKGHSRGDHEMCASCWKGNDPEIITRLEKRFEQLALAIAHGKVSVQCAAGCEAEGYDKSGHVHFAYAGNVKRILPVDGRYCGSCRKELKSGMRWWVCGLCRGECRDHIHPPLVRQRDMWNADVEKTGGLEDVENDGAVHWWKKWF